MITLYNLKEYVIDFIETNKSGETSKPSIIYFSIGSYCYSIKYNEKLKTNKKHWSKGENQQFPPFLFDFKLKNLDIPILIILIDPTFNDESPYVVSSSDNFLEKSWSTSHKFSNLYLSSFGLNVIKISDKILWGDMYNNSSQINFDFENLIVEICELISKPTNNTLMFYHEFTGSNVILLEHLIKKKASEFDFNKICIDITRGSNMSCYFNLLNPEFYPVIILDEFNKIKYINPDMLTNENKTNIIKQYKKITDDFKDFKDFNNILQVCDFLFQTQHQIILCLQIINSDKIILNYILNGILPIIRYFYVCNEKKIINLKMWGIHHLISLQNNIRAKYSVEYLDNRFMSSCLNTLNNVFDNIKLISSINQNELSDNLNELPNNPDHDENINFLKNEIISNLFIVMKEVLTDIVIKYEINILEVEKLINELKEIKDKYHMIDIYKKFISKLNINHMIFFI